MKIATRSFWTDSAVTSRSMIVAGAALAAVLMIAPPSAAQDDGAPNGSALEEARRSAERAEAAADRAREALERLRTARQGPSEEEPAAPPSEESTAEDDAELEEAETPKAEQREKLDESIARAERAAREANAAAREARALVRELRDAFEAHENRYARTGFLLGGAATYAVENFDTDLNVDNSRGLAAFVGYRVHRHVSVEARGEWLEGFDVVADSPGGGAFDAEVDGYAVTANTKFYPLTGSLQPFAGLGLGAFRANLEGTGRSGQRINQSSTEFVFRLAGGLDYFLSENLVLNLEASYLAPGGELTNLDYGNFSAGVTFRF